MNLAEKYHFIASSKAGNREGTMLFNVSGETLEGSVDLMGEENPILDGKMAKSKFSFALKIKGMKIIVNGEIVNDVQITGTIKLAFSGMNFEGTKVEME